MDGEDAMEESYMMKGKSIGKRDRREQRERKKNKGECIKRERETVLFPR